MHVVVVFVLGECVLIMEFVLFVCVMHSCCSLCFSVDVFLLFGVLYLLLVCVVCCCC